MADHGVSKAIVDRLTAAGRRLPKPLVQAVAPRARRLVAAWSEPPPPPPPPPPRTLPIPPLRAIPPGPDPIEVPVPGPEALTVWPEAPPPDYLGQLTPEFQEGLAKRWAEVRLEDCYFYHRSLLPDGRFIEGAWNLIGGEKEYLGGVELEGRRVLELGPASGWLTVWMEQQGARVVGFDVGWDLQPDLIPLPNFDLAVAGPQQIAFISHVQNAWWLLHREYGLQADAVYGSIYDLPADLGRFDVSVFGSILLHLRDPFRALHQAAMRTDEAIVVVEPLRHGPAEVSEPVLRWNVTGSVSPNGWWGFSPGAIVDMLGVLGFPHATVTYHRQPYRPENNPVEGATDMVNFTVVARRR
jgi:O-methyltransferase